MDIKRERKTNRLKSYDYAVDGCYFVTICCKNRVNYLGEIRGGKMFLNNMGKIVQMQLQHEQLNNSDAALAASVIMPNHVHLVVRIVGTGLRPVRSLSDIIGNLKKFSSLEINKQNPEILFSWQRSFYDRIIRNEVELRNIYQYILDNPKNWDIDENNLTIDCDKS
jgi:REP element-mobilizing transposase RayT